MSSHPGALLALLRALDTTLSALDLDFTRTHAPRILAASPVEYIRRAKLRGSLFSNNHGGEQDEGGVQEDGSVCVADSGFWVDHTEPMAVLGSVREGRGWPLGELPEGCEWLVLVRSDHASHGQEEW